MKKKILMASLFALATICCLTSSPGAAAQYTWTELPYLGLVGQAYGINDQGQVVGFQCVNEACDSTRAFLWTQTGGLQYLDEPGDDGIATAINSSGQVVGAIIVPIDSLVELHAFLWTKKGGLQDLGEGNALGINDKGDITGLTWVDGERHAYVRNKKTGVMQDLGTLQGYDESIGRGINNQGEVIGGAGGDPDFLKGFFWSPKTGQMQPLVTLGGNLSYPTSINNQGLVAGYATNGDGAERAVLWSPKTGQIQNLGVLKFGNLSNAYSINDLGYVVGFSHTTTTGGNRAFIWTQAEGMQNLNDMVVALPAGVSLRVADCINNKGQIVARGIKEGLVYSYLLTPLIIP